MWKSSYLTNQVVAKIPGENNYSYNFYKEGQTLLNNKVFVVTVSAAAIRPRFVRGISERGGIAIVEDTKIDAAKLLAQDCTGCAQAVHLDISSKESILDLIANLPQRHGRIDELVNNA